MARSIASFTGIALLGALGAACDRSGVTEQQKGQTEMQQMQNAQANAEQEIAAARAEFQKTREDYLHDKRTDLVDLDEKIARLDAEEKSANGKLKSDIAEHMPTVHALREAFGRNIQTLSRTPPSAWDSAKVETDKEWEALKNAIDDVPSR